MLFKNLKQNYIYLSENLSGYTKQEIFCLRISFVGFIFYFLQEIQGFNVPRIFMTFWAISLFFLGYVMVKSSYRNFKECYSLLYKNTFPVQGRFYIYGSLFLKMAPQGAKYIGGTIGIVSGINYMSVEFFDVSPAREFSKYMGWTPTSSSIEDLQRELLEKQQQIDKLNTLTTAQQEQIQKIIEDSLKKK